MTTVREAGRRGGLSTLAKHGIAHFRRAGVIGGKTTAVRRRKKLKEWEVKGGSTRKAPKARVATLDTQHTSAGNHSPIKRPDTLPEPWPVGSTEKAMAQREAGRKGGLSTLKRYGRTHMSLIGSLGGRPTFEEAVAGARLVRGGEQRWGSQKKEVWGHRLEPCRCSCRALLSSLHDHFHDSVELSATRVAHFDQVNTKGTKSE